MGLPLASYKLRFHEQHVRAVPSKDEAGCPFSGPGVDLRGQDARVVLEAAGPIRAWLEAREPGIALRALSVDVAKPRVLVSLEGSPGERPRVLRIDAPQAIELVEAGRELERLLGEACAAKIRAR